MKIKVEPAKSFSGVTEVPGDKSVSHRSLIFGAIATGETVVTHLLDSGDVRSTAQCLRQMGVAIKEDGGKVIVTGSGKHGLQAPTSVLDCGNSGTTIRLLMGLLAGQRFSSTLTGDDSLRRRPMKRVGQPLELMGAEIKLTKDGFAPVTVVGKKLHGIEYELKVASAQVKTSLLLAGLYAEGRTVLRGEIGSRDHTERMLPYFGVKLRTTRKDISITGDESLHGAAVEVPGDPSSAAFWMAAAALVRGGSVEIKNISLNPTRTGFMEVLKRMGAKIEEEVTVREPEPIGHVRVSAQGLRGTYVHPHEIPALIDEVPVLAVLGSQAEGRTEVRGAGELRVKESDRIEAVAKNLRAMGVEIETFQDGFAIEGPQKLKGALIDSFDDHRIAMAFSIAGLVAQGTTEIDRTECVGISYPKFFEVLRKLTRA